MHYGIHGSTLNFYLIVRIHNFSGIILSFNYLLFFIGNFRYGNIRFYRLKVKGWMRRLMKQTEYYAFGMFKGQPAPFPLSEKRKFNPLQKYSYFFTMYLILPLIIASGLALLFPELIIEDVYNVSGVFLTALLHAAMGFIVLMFLIVHVYAASIGKDPLKNYMSMIDGWHDLNH